ncbi:TetR/AcrR family transcriptional regulator [Granulicoccus phenolivorans]|uniref:TetR/AcrR family transcriptional regulator n=1 Tax=Granulicoccus phenolivorans TaxID=266854 RepID=UPI00040DAFBE|nr:TetR/AcrR family transcriptional regulator [Granulicoccus phenolivorans]
MTPGRQRWLEAGVEALAEEGAVDALRIDRMVERVGLSTGSFYYHFQGMPGFKKALLAHLEEVQTAGFADLIAATPVDPGNAAHSAANLIETLAAARAGYRRPRLEAALRAWALTDPDAAHVQARIDESRLETIRAVWRQVTTDEEEVRLGALLPYVIAIGASAIMPPLSDDDLDRLYQRIISLTPPGASESETLR